MTVRPGYLPAALPAALPERGSPGQRCSSYDGVISFFWWRIHGQLLSSLWFRLFSALIGALVMSHVSATQDGYRVPERFSIAEILVMITVFGLLFGALRFFRAPATIYLFLGTQAVVVCLVQMWFGAVPRGASTFVGCLFLPLWIWLLSATGNQDLPVGSGFGIVELPFVSAFGGLLGYCTGALAAGVFLIMDAVDGSRNRLARSQPTQHPNS